MIRIGLTGPESSGKTTLCQALADHYNSSFIPEAARAYLAKTNGLYHPSDLDEIANQQLKNILASEQKLVISDSDFTVLEVWSKYKYGGVSATITELVEKEIFDLHILCTPDIPWEEDPLRENPENRDELFELYKLSLAVHRKKFYYGFRDKREAN
jgi:nicotinamide riboside kinase